MTHVRRAFFVNFVLFLTACAGTHQPSSQSLQITSVPEGAAVRVSNGVDCVTPCRVQAARNKYLMLTFTKAGCLTQSQLLPPPSLGDKSIRHAASEVMPNRVFVSLSCGA
jgi:hypothetical protein